MQFSFENLIFDVPTILRKQYFGTNWHYMCAFKHPPKIRETVKKKNLDQFLTQLLDQFLTRLLDQFLTQLLDQFLTQKPKSWTNF